MRIILVLSLIFICSCQENTGEGVSGINHQAEAPEYTLDVPEVHSLSMTFAGDIMAHDKNYRMKDYNDIYTGVLDVLKNDDISFGNLEFVVDENRPYMTYPRFNVKRPYVEAAIKAGFDVFAMANNHTLDHDDDGVLATIESMELFKERDGIIYSGIHTNPKKVFEPVSFTHNGISVGFLSVAGFSNRGAGMQYMAHVYLPNKDKHDGFVETIKKIADKYDLFVLAVHYGTEHERDLEYPMTNLYSRLIDVGVDILWGHHPHVLQPAFMPIGPDGMRKLIIHSNGNFVSSMHSMVRDNMPTHRGAYTGDSALYQVNAVMRGNAVEITTADPLLISNYKDPVKGTIVDRLHTLAETKLAGNWQNYFKERITLMEGEAPVFRESRNAVSP